MRGRKAPRILNVAIRRWYVTVRRGDRLGFFSEGCRGEVLVLELGEEIDWVVWVQGAEGKS